MKLWIARDRDGGLYLYSEKPKKNRRYFLFETNNIMCLDRNIFPEVTFENSPQEVELKLIKEL